MKSKKTFTLSILAVLIISITALSFIISKDNIPKGWIKAGTVATRDSYEIGMQEKAGYNGAEAVYIKSLKDSINGFSTLMQYFSAKDFLKQRVRFSGYIKSKDVAEWAGLWMRIDGKGNPPKTLGFDNMQNRSIKGTTDWKKYDVVLNVPAGSNSINIGVLMGGTGEIWTSNLKFEKVDKTVPTTDRKNNIEKHDKPVNLNFQK